MKKYVRDLRDTFTLFSSFLDCESKNSKRKSSPNVFFIIIFFCVCCVYENLTSNSLEKTKQIVCVWVLEIARQTGHRW